MRKKITFIAAVIAITPALQAQIQKGDIYLGGNAGIGVLQFNNDYFQPAIEAGISKHSTLGLFYYSTRYNAASFSGVEGYSTKKGGGLSFTYHRYFGSKTKWGWYMNATAGLYDIKVVDKIAGRAYLNNRYRQAELTITPGIFFTPSSRLMLYANFGGFSLTNNKHEFAVARVHFPNYFSIGARFSIGGSKRKNN